MSRRRFSLGMVLALLVLGAAAAATAATPPGPRLGLMRLGVDQKLKFELLNVDVKGQDALVIVGGTEKSRPLPDLGNFAWSPDGASLLFAGLTGKLKNDNRRTDLYLAAADGTSLTRVPGTKGAISPVLAPDGHTYAFARERERQRPNGRGGEETAYESVSVWLGDLGGGAPRQATPWRNRIRQVPSSFSADVKTLAVTRLVADKTPEAIGLELDGSADSVLVRNAIEPVYSPDGSKLAFLRGPVRTYGNITSRVTDLYVMTAGGGELKRLTNTSRAMELSPSWDPSGQRLAWIEWNPFRSESAFFGLGNKLMQGNPDGSCLNKALSYRKAGIYAIRWQPGPGREAGPIVC